MHSVHPQNINELANSDDLARALELTKDGGVAWENRAPIDFLDAKKK